MGKFPLMQDGRPVGELITEREALYTCLLYTSDAADE